MIISKSRLLITGVLLCQFTILSAQSFDFDESSNQVESKLLDYGEQFVKMMNVPSEERAIALAREIFVASSADDWAVSFRKEYGEVSEGRMRVTSGALYSTVHVIVNSKKLNDWRNFQLVYENEGSKKCGRVNAVLAAPPLALPKGLISDPDVVSVLGDYMDRLFRDERLSGSFLVARGNEVLLQKHGGMANRESNRAITGETPINLASSGKMFTTVSILRLIEEGKMELDDPMIEFIPDYPDQSFARQVTVANLLSHTSGIPDFWDDDYEKHWGDINSLEQYLPYIVNKPRTFESPGNKGAYSNSNFILLGLIIEKVTGEDYFIHVQRTIFDPLEMTNTGFFKKSQDDRIAVGYLDLGKEDAIRTRGGLMGSSAGGALSTTADMMKFKRALVSHQLVGEGLLDLATSRQSLLNGNGSYGYGFVIEEGMEGYGHGGQGPGSGVVFIIEKSSDYAVILLTNDLNGAFSELSFSIQELLRR